MNDCPRQNPAYRSASLFNKTPLRRGFCFLSRLSCLMALRLSGLLGVWNGFCRLDKVVTPPSGKCFPDSVAIDSPQIRRLFPTHLTFISFLLMFLISFIRGNVSRDISCFVMSNTKRYAIRFYREQSRAIDLHHKISC